MRQSTPSTSRASFVFILMLICLVGLPACTCSETIPIPTRPVWACKGKRASPTIAPALQNRAIVTGALQTSFDATASGDAALALSLPVIPGRAGVAPDIAIHYSSGNVDHGVLGVGFSLTAGSSISRRSKTTAIDGEIVPVLYTKDDAFALDEKSLVFVAEQTGTREYRTWPDNQIRIVQKFNDNTESYFEAFLPDGSRVLYGASESTRPMANTGFPRAWLAEEQRDPRGNAMLFDYCFAEDNEGTTVEYALTSIRYSAFEDEEPLRAVVFAYDVRKDAEIKYARGMQLQESLQLAEIQVQGPDNELVRRYEFDYAPSETTGRSVLQSVQACAGSGCSVPAG